MGADRVVFDANILISSILSGAGRPAQCFDWVLAHGVIVMSADILGELQSRIVRPKFAKYIKQDRLDWVTAKLMSTAFQVQLTGALQICRDPDDDKVLETALIGQADFIVTGDKDLLFLHPFRGVKILGPFDFLTAVASPTP